MYRNVANFFVVFFLFLLSVSCKSKKACVNCSCDSCYSLFVYPYDGAIIFGDSPVVGISFHPSEITRVIISISSNDGKRRTYSADIKSRARWYFLLKTREFSDGAYTIDAVAYDSSGNSSQDSVSVKIKNDISDIISLIPSFSSFLVPQNGQIIFGVSPVIGISIHPRRITDVRLDIYSESQSRTTYKLQATYVWYHFLDTTTLPEGVYTLEVSAKDDHGFQSQSQITAVVSKSPSFPSLINILPIFYGDQITYPSYITYPVYMTYPFSSTSVILYPPSGVSMSKMLCSTTPFLCNVLGFYAMPAQATSVLLLVDDVATKQGNIFQLSSTYPSMGTFIISDWWSGLSSGTKKLRSRVFAMDGNLVESQDVQLNLTF